MWLLLSRHRHKPSSDLRKHNFKLLKAKYCLVRNFINTKVKEYVSSNYSQWVVIKLIIKLLTVGSHTDCHPTPPPLAPPLAPPLSPLLPLLPLLLHIVLILPPHLLLYQQPPLPGCQHPPRSSTLPLHSPHLLPVQHMIYNGRRCCLYDMDLVILCFLMWKMVHFYW